MKLPSLKRFILFSKDNPEKLSSIGLPSDARAIANYIAHFVFRNPLEPFHNRFSDEEMMNINITSSAKLEYLILKPNFKEFTWPKIIDYCLMNTLKPLNALANSDLRQLKMDCLRELNAFEKHFLDEVFITNLKNSYWDKDILWDGTKLINPKNKKYAVGWQYKKE